MPRLLRLLRLPAWSRYTVTPSNREESGSSRPVTARIPVATTPLALPTTTVEKTSEEKAVLPPDRSEKPSASSSTNDGTALYVNISWKTFFSDELKLLRLKNLRKLFSTSTLIGTTANDSTKTDENVNKPRTLREEYISYISTSQSAMGQLTLNILFVIYSVFILIRSIKLFTSFESKLRSTTDDDVKRNSLVDSLSLAVVSLAFVVMVYISGFALFWALYTKTENSGNNKLL